MRKFFIIIFLILPLLSAAQVSSDTAPAQEEKEVNDFKILEYNDKPQKAVFSNPLKLTFTLPEEAVFDGDNLSQKDFEIISLKRSKDNPLLVEMTVLPFNLQISTLTALGFTSMNGDKFKTEELEINIEEIPSKIKGLIDIRGPFRPFNIFPYIFIVLVIVALVYAIIRFVKHKKQPKPLNLTPYEKKERPMHEIALSQLDMLARSDLWEKNEYKLYYSEISDILRQFLSARFNFEAQKMTARELLKKLKDISDFKFDFNTLKNFQQNIVLVKFAKLIPTAEERDYTLKTAKEIILTNKETDLSRYQNSAVKQGGDNEKTN